MSITDGALALILILGAAGCTVPSASPTQGPPSPAGAVATSPAAQSTLALTATPTPAPPASPTPDLTQSANATFESIYFGVAASGVPEGSGEFDARVDATRCAVMPPPTPTSLPWELEPVGALTESSSCTGQDLPGRGTRLWLSGRWVEAEAFTFARTADLRAVQLVYEQYMDFLSFQDGPPSERWPDELEQHLASTDSPPLSDSCTASDVARTVAALSAQGVYVRLTFAEPLTWMADRVHLDFGPRGVWAALGWNAGRVTQELVEIGGGRVTRRETAALSGTARFAYDPARDRFVLVDDGGGYFCSGLGFFVR